MNIRIWFKGINGGERRVDTRIAKAYGASSMRRTMSSAA
jgi:hypothetical protein